MTVLKPVIRTLLMSFTLLGSSGCVTNSITGRNQAMLVSDTQAAQQSATVYSQLLNEAQRGGTLDESKDQLDRIQKIAQLLVAQAVKMRPETRQWAWDVHVLESDEVNAWCMAGGKMAVYTGLLAKIQPTEDEIAQVMGHEIAHALLSHQAEKLSRAQMQKVGLTAAVLAGSVAGYNVQGAANFADQIATLGLQLPNSRQAESEADSVGIELASKAGFDPRAAVSLWQKMLRVSGGSNGPEWLSTHPDPQSRIQAMQVRAQQLLPIYEATKHPESKNTESKNIR